jgi:hypothetical protein
MNIGGPAPIAEAVDGEDLTEARDRDIFKLDC